MALPIAAFAGGMAAGLFKDFTGPIIGQNMSDFRNMLGWNDVARSRNLHYGQNYRSCTPANSANYTPVRMGFGQLLTLFNQAHWPWEDNDPDVRDAIWEWLQNALRFDGINIDISEFVPGTPPIAGVQGSLARNWARLIDKSSEGPPLGLVLRNYYRGRGQNILQPWEGEPELIWQFRKAGIRRPADRRQIMEPYYPFSVEDAWLLNWRGVVDAPTRDSIIESDGCVKVIDKTFVSHLARRLPTPEQLIHWAEQGLWDPFIVESLHLDQSWQQNPIAQFFLRRQGVGIHELPFPDEPEGERDWAKLAYRSTRKMPSYEQALHMQWKLRDDPRNPGISIVPGTEMWSEADTAAVLRYEGMPATLASQMIGASNKPLDMDFIGETMSLVLEHPAVERVKTRLFGEGYAWLLSEMLNHGFDRKYAELATEVVKWAARDKAYAERNTARTAIRHERRDLAFKGYEQGTVGTAEVYRICTHTMYTQKMVEAKLENIDTKIVLELNETKIAAIKEAFMSGDLAEPQVIANLVNIGVTTFRTDQYVEEWKWLRTTKTKHMQTGDILSSLKAGIMSAPQAITRLTNLGWTQPDALAEIALLQREMQITQQKQAAALAARQAALIQSQANAAQAAALRQKAQLAKLTAEKARIDRAKALASHQKLMAESSYYAKIHGNNAAYAAAKKAKNQDKMDAEIANSAADYQKWLIDQLKLITHSPEVANVVGPLQTEPTPDTGEGEAADESASGTDTPPVEPAKPDGGTSAEEPTKPVVPGQPSKP